MPHDDENARAMMSQLFLQTDMEDVQTIAVGPGTAAVYSKRNPAKDTPNEDALAVLPWDDRSAVLAVADGVGGTIAGARASELAVQALDEALQKHEGERLHLRSAVIDGIEAANHRIRQLEVDAATTLAVAEIHRRTFRTYHVGDSMILVINGRGRIKWQTVSHSPIGFAVESGFMDEKEAMYHEDRHLVSNVVGADDMRIEIGPTLTLGKRDTILLSSDGLFDNLLVDEVVQILRGDSLAEAIRQLGHAARRRMTEPASGQPSKPDDMAILAYRATGS